MAIVDENSRTLPRSMDEEVRRFIEEWQSPADYIVAHTSGSTGTPKEIRLPKKLVEESARRTIEYFHLTADSHLHLCLSPNYIAGKMMIVRSLLSGCTLTIEEPSNNPLKGCMDPIDLLAVVPTQLMSICERKDALPAIKNIIVGGAPLSNQQRKVAIASGLNIVETYGMTETASHVALRKVAEPANPFCVLPGIRISLDSRECLVIESDSFGRIVTNDVAKLVSEKEFFVLGRIDNIINSGGVKIFPNELEEGIGGLLSNYKLDSYKIAIVGVPDLKWGEVPALAIEMNPESAKSDEVKALSATLFLQMRKRFGAKKYPRKILFLSQFPRTSSGKILHRKIAEMAEFEISEK